MRSANRLLHNKRAISGTRKEASHLHWPMCWPDTFLSLSFGGFSGAPKKIPWKMG